LFVVGFGFIGRLVENRDLLAKLVEGTYEQKHNKLRLRKSTTTKGFD